MADKMTVMRKWLDDIKNDENITVTDVDEAYILYAMIHYGLYGEKINISEIFGKEHGTLNYLMPNIYGQIDNIQNYKPADNNGKYDADKIYQLRLEGHTAKQICQELGYPVEKWRSLTSNKGWTDAGEELKKRGKNVSEMSDLTKSNPFNF